MIIKRNAHTLTVECQSLIETARVFSALVAVETQSVENISPSPQAILSSLDSLEEYLTTNRRVEQQCIEAKIRYKS